MRYILGWTTLILVSFSCSPSSDTPDISKVDISWKFVPYHLEQKNLTETKEYVSQTLSKYPQFGKLFFTSVLPILDLSQEEQDKTMTDPGFNYLIDTCTLIYNDIEDLKLELDRAFKYYNHYTGDEQIPNVYTFVSGFAYQNFVFQDDTKDGLGIGLDMYMGSSFPYKAVDQRNPVFSEFLTQYFDKKYLVRKSLLSWLDDKIPSAQSSQLIDMTIRNGKIIYILEKILPSAPKDIILEYQPDEYQWCLQNEPELWTHLLKNDLLYSNDFSKINKLVNPSPGAPGIPEEAPGAVANYVGWRIVQDYVKRNNVKMTDLMNTTDFQKILDESKYRPRMRKG